MLKNRKDAYLIALAALNVALITLDAVVAGRGPHSTGFNVFFHGGISIAVIYLYLTNYQCISHYHIHKPYFTSRPLNKIFSLFNTLALGVPQTMYHVHHQFHHKGNNDMRDPVTNTTVDFASSYRFSKHPNVEEGFWSFSLKSVFRGEITPLWQNGVRQGWTKQIVAEFIVMFSFWALLIFFSWKSFVFFYLPTWLLGQMLNYAENYLEHHGATHTSRLNDSVSCYNPIYNWLWFNNGYHQEHHYRPGVHWALLPEVRSLMLDESKRRVVKYCHIFNHPIFHKKKSAAQTASLTG